MYSLVAKIKDVIGDRLGLCPSPQLFPGNDDRIEMHGQPKPPIEGPGRATWSLCHSPILAHPGAF